MEGIKLEELDKCEFWNYRVFKESSDMLDTYTIRECLYLDKTPHTWASSGSPVVGITEQDAMHDLTQQFEAFNHPVLVLNSKGELIKEEPPPIEAIKAINKLKDIVVHVNPAQIKDNCSHTITHMDVCVNCGHDLKGE